MASGASSRFGARTTAEEALDGVSLDGKTAIVTGANSGIGVETARVLGLAGAHVVMACRSKSSAESVAKDFLVERCGTFDVEALDLSDLASVRAFAARFAAKKRPLHLLVNNAGVMATPLGKTAQGHELQVGTNHVGHFLLTKLLRPIIEESGPARIVTVSSAIHPRGRAARLFETLEADPGYARRTYRPFDAYADSKLANVLFTRQLAKGLPSSVTAFSLHPGVIATNLTRSMGIAGSIFRSVGSLFTKSVAQGAATTIVAATSPAIEAESGAYLSDCQIARTSRDARDDGNAAKLWEMSERLVASFATPLAG
jgi:NAD(P)-dependent dehydrogenase (short-subunit alcohol dehydrogenase family)